jgi:hypothetical protein
MSNIANKIALLLIKLVIDASFVVAAAVVVSVVNVLLRIAVVYTPFKCYETDIQDVKLEMATMPWHGKIHTERGQQ